MNLMYKLLIFVKVIDKDCTLLIKRNTLSWGDISLIESNGNFCYTQDKLDVKIRKFYYRQRKEAVAESRELMGSCYGQI